MYDRGPSTFYDAPHATTHVVTSACSYASVPYDIMARWGCAAPHSPCPYRNPTPEAVRCPRPRPRPSTTRRSPRRAPRRGARRTCAPCRCTTRVSAPRPSSRGGCTTFPRGTPHQKQPDAIREKSFPPRKTFANAHEQESNQESQDSNEDTGTALQASAHEFLPKIEANNFECKSEDPSPEPQVEPVKKE